MHPKTLYLHSHGQQVRALQLLLKKYEPGLAVDGRFGPRTEHAVRAAQRKLGIFPADGMAGPHTLDGLAKAAKTTNPLPRAVPPAHPSSGARLGSLAHQAGAAEHAVVNTVEEAIAAIEKWIAGLHPQEHPVPANLHPVVQPSKAKAKTEPQPPGAVGDPKTMHISPAGRHFVFEHEAGDGSQSAHLHHPSPDSGVTLGPGYDMGARHAPTIEQDLVQIGVAQATAAAVAKAALLTGEKADAFVKANSSLIKLTMQQQILLEQLYQGPLETRVQHSITVPLHQYEFDALVSFSGNAGKNATGWNTTARLVNDHKYAEAMAEIHKYVHSGKKGGGVGPVMQGLVNRRDAEAALFLYGNYHWHTARHSHHS